MLKLPLT